ncbi:MAG: TlpA disulfide reductase family protein, partial [Ilumatobacteraceae bacterium]
MNSRRLFVTVALLTVVAAVALAAFVILGRGTSMTASKLIGQPVPNVALAQIDGDSAVRLGSPGHVVVVNFWAPWCVPCLGEHQMLNRVAGSFPADKVRFVGVAYQSADADVDDF